METKLPLRYYKGEQENPFAEAEKGLQWENRVRSRFWDLERNIAHTRYETVIGIFDETTPNNWPDFLRAARATRDELAVGYFLWLDFVHHCYGSDGCEWWWNEYFKHGEANKNGLVTIKATFRLKPEAE